MIFALGESTSKKYFCRQGSSRLFGNYFFGHLRGRPVIARVFEQEDAAKIEAAGGIPIVLSKATADTFLEWMDANDRLK